MVANYYLYTIIILEHFDYYYLYKKPSFRSSPLFSRQLGHSFLFKNVFSEFHASISAFR